MLNSPSNQPPTHRVPKERDIVYFVHLHLHTLRSIPNRCSIDGHSLYEVKGKSRPMLIVRVLSDERGCRWYRVIPITSRRETPKGHIHLPIRRLPDSEHENSYIDPDDPRKLPENMIDATDARSPIIQSLDFVEFGNILKCVQHRLLGGPSYPTIR